MIRRSRNTNEAIEACAARICATVLGGEPTRADVQGGPSARHDYDIALKNGRRVALEITRATIDRERAAHASIAKRTGEVPGLAVSWMLTVMMDVISVKRLYGDAPDHLNTLTKAGIHEFRASRAPERHARKAYDALIHLGIRGGRDFPDVLPPQFLFSVREFGSTSPNAVVAIAEHETSKSDNLNKLANADADERHLWVWVESSETGAYVMLRSHQYLPSRPPQLPEPISTVWVAALTSDRDGVLVSAGLWRGTREGWHGVTLPPGTSTEASGDAG